MRKYTSDVGHRRVLYLKRAFKMGSISPIFWWFFKLPQHFWCDSTFINHQEHNLLGFPSCLAIPIISKCTTTIIWPQFHFRKIFIYNIGNTTVIYRGNTNIFLKINILSPGKSSKNVQKLVRKMMKNLIIASWSFL